MRSLIILMLICFSSYSSAKTHFDSEFAKAQIGERPDGRGRYLMRWLPEDLIGWTDPASMSTTNLSSQCGVLSEVKLLGESRHNLIFIGVVNDSNKDITIKRNEISAVFSGGRERVMNESRDQASEDIKSKWYGWGFASFPSKNDFKDQESVKISVPIAQPNGSVCKLEVIFERNKQAPAGVDDYIEAPNKIWSLGYIQSVGITPAAATTFNNFKPDGGLFYAGNFDKVSFGSFMAIDIQTLGDIYPSNYYNSSKYAHAVLIGVSGGPAWRSIYSDNFSGYMNTGFSLGYMKAESRIKDDEGGARFSPGIYTSYTIEWRYHKGKTSLDEGDNSIGLTLFAKYYPWVFDGDRTDYGTVGVSFYILRGGR